MRGRSVYSGRYVIMAVAYLAFFALFTYVFMLLWNWLVPELFKGPGINYWQGLGILVLAKILFTGFGYRRNHYHWRRPWHYDPEQRSEWKRKFQEKMRERCMPSGHMHHGSAHGSAHGSSNDGAHGDGQAGYPGKDKAGNRGQE